MSDPEHNSHASLAELDALPTAELQERAFHRARERRDVGFFVSLFEHLPTGETGEDGSFGLQSTVDDAVAAWKDATHHEYGAEEPLVRAAFIDYLLKH
jgi:hypothetical protein